MQCRTYQIRPGLSCSRNAVHLHINTGSHPYCAYVYPSSDHRDLCMRATGKPATYDGPAGSAVGRWKVERRTRAERDLKALVCGQCSVDGITSGHFRPRLYLQLSAPDDRRRSSHPAFRISVLVNVQRSAANFDLGRDGRSSPPPLPPTTGIPTLLISGRVRVREVEMGNG